MERKAEAHENAIAVGLAVRAFYRKRALALVAAAVRKGRLPRLFDNPTACIDCGNRAFVYEHRDYMAPLDVEPVCDKCNHRRGITILDPPDVLDHLSNSARFPYRINLKRYTEAK